MKVWLWWSKIFSFPEFVQILIFLSLDFFQIEAATKYSTVDTLKQQYCFIPAKYKVFLLLGLLFFCLCQSNFVDFDDGSLYKYNNNEKNKKREGKGYMFLSFLAEYIFSYRGGEGLTFKLLKGIKLILLLDLLCYMSFCTGVLSCLYLNWDVWFNINGLHSHLWRYSASSIDSSKSWVKSHTHKWSDDPGIIQWLTFLFSGYKIFWKLKKELEAEYIHDLSTKTSYKKNLEVLKTLIFLWLHHFVGLLKLNSLHGPCLDRQRD